MARPSVSSQSLVDLASTKMRSKKPKDSFENNSSPPSTPSDTETVPETGSKQGWKRKQENHLNIEMIRKKYTLQNKSLAKNNSMMMLKIAEMESKVSDLINENMTLRKRRTFRDAEFKKKLESKLDVIETGLMLKFDEIMQTLKNIRSSEGITGNPRLDIFKCVLDDEPPSTSTPIESESQKSYINFTSKSPALPSLKDGSFTLPKSHVYLQSIDSEPMSFDVPKSKEQVEEKENMHLDISEVQLAEVPTLEKPSDVINEKPMNLYNESSTDLVSEIKEPGDNPAVDDHEHSAIIENDEFADNQSKKFEVYRETNVEAKQTEKSTMKPKKSESRKKNKSLEIEASMDEQDETKREENDPEESRRPSRSRKQVSYKWPSLSKKMRRPSEKFVDAVVVKNEEVELADPKIKQEHEQQGMRKRNTEDLDADNAKLTKKSKRQPLSNVTNKSNNEANSRRSFSGELKTTKLNQKVNNAFQDEAHVSDNSSTQIGKNDIYEDPSIFDFDDGKPLKTYRKKKNNSHLTANKGEQNNYEKRRHSMLI